MMYTGIAGVPDFEAKEFFSKSCKYCICIPIINEGKRIHEELRRGMRADITSCADIIICDGGSTDGSVDEGLLKKLKVNSVLVKRGAGRQGAQLRMGFYWALQRGYDGIITIDGNNKDSIESVPLFVEKLDEGYDFVQGSRFIEGGRAVNTPLLRYLAVRFLHAPVISLTAGKWYTDTTNAYRGHSRKYLEDERVDVFRDIFSAYELLAYLSVRADQLGLRTCEVPVRREYPAVGKLPTKISFLKGNWSLLQVLFGNLFGLYKPGR